ncbi:hypothetical protein DCC79_09490 [bacterium]|nr:hypothetical protein [Chloroflexi bacterium CFX6]RIL09958.1 MAG: hypothetical protein DCC79_09490 [bacterium]
MNLDMQRAVDHYVARLRRAMRGASPDVAAEIEREIRGHIEDALAARAAPAVGDLRDVLERLGAPEEYARDLVLYMMVDRGYRHWSLPHMLRSTVFWSLSTLAGAVVVLTFGVLYALALAASVAATLAIIAPDGWGARWAGDLAGVAGRSAPAPWLAAIGGPLALAGLTIVVRWFVGQYVRHARPHAVPASAAGDWARQAERRILAIAGLGFATTLVAGFGSGAYRFDEAFRPALPPDYLGSPLGLVSGAGLLMLVLAPVLGVLWSIVSPAAAADEASGL